MAYATRCCSRLVKQQDTKDVINAVEELDGALKRKEDVAACKGIVTQLTDRIGVVLSQIDMSAQ